MYLSQQPWVDLYDSLLEYEGSDVYADILATWPERNGSELRWLSELSGRMSRNRSDAKAEDLCRLYSASRVTELLLLPFQTGNADGSDYAGPPIRDGDFRQFHEALSFEVVDRPEFHPFDHEIVSVEVAAEAEAEAPIRIVESRWPTLTLGQMLYMRGGCHVSGGSRHISQEIAETSVLYWATRRKHRRCEDPSQGWGGNSRWRTAFRRDFRTSDGYEFNIDGSASLNDRRTKIDGIPIETMIECVRYRSLIQSQVDEMEIDPYRYRYSESFQRSAAKSHSDSERL